MPKIPSLLRVAYDDLCRTIQEVKARAGSGQGTRELLDATDTFLQVVSSLPAANAELQRHRDGLPLSPASSCPQLEFLRKFRLYGQTVRKLL
jgi:hypothetical protein